MSFDMQGTEFDLLLAYGVFWLCLLVYAIRSYRNTRAIQRRIVRELR